MNGTKQGVRRKLVAAMLTETCARSPSLVFRDAWCTQERVIRFTTPFFRELFPVGAKEDGKWRTGDRVMYEAHNAGDALCVECVLGAAGAAGAETERRKALLRAAGIPEGKAASGAVLRRWNLTATDGDVNRMIGEFARLTESGIPDFERGLRERMASDASAERIVEGARKAVTSNQYERNPKARAACIAAYGTACSVCGIDLGKAYGPELAGRIEVHHIVPLSEIGKEYVVDPVRDLRPVCPNCHMALHSKKDGVYTIEELKAIRSGDGRGR